MITKLLLNKIKSLKKNIVALKEVNAVLKRGHEDHIGRVEQLYELRVRELFNQCSDDKRNLQLKISDLLIANQSLIELNIKHTNHGN